MFYACIITVVMCNTYYINRPFADVIDKLQQSGAGSKPIPSVEVTAYSSADNGNTTTLQGVGTVKHKEHSLWVWGEITQKPGQVTLHAHTTKCISPQVSCAAATIYITRWHNNTTRIDIYLYLRAIVPRVRLRVVQRIINMVAADKVAQLLYNVERKLLEQVQ